MPAKSLPAGSIPHRFAQDDSAMAALDDLLLHPEKLHTYLILAGGLCQGREMYAASAACLIAAHELGLDQGVA